MTSVLTSGWCEQKVVEVTGVKIGGYPGTNPALLVGSIFYMGDKLLLSKEGDIDREAASKVIEEALSLTDSLGLRLGLDVVFPTEESVGRILPFIAEYDVPLFLDSPEPKARVRAYLMAKELGIEGKSIANGIYVNTGSEELRAISESDVHAAVLLAFDPASPATSMKAEERVRILEESLIPLARRAGLENVLADAVVLDPASIAISAEAIYMFKKKLGLPSGCAPANALGPASKKALGTDIMYGVHGGAAAMLRLHGADFIMYGPVKRIKYVAPTIAMVDSLLGYIARMQGHKISREHPTRKLLKNIQQIFARS
ncbi:MAG: tetrahydromethanopterin S-methyltransferase subunit H [Desulfurococcales archaeon]|nr:tetrahydromethanopterin S-methyltransferase subunit H [Desulfurococcales archaeon]